MSARTLASRQRLLVAITCACVCAISLVQATSASAASYSVKSCDASTEDKSSFGLEWASAGLGYFIHAQNNCPAGISFDPGQTVQLGTKFVAWFRPYSDSVIKSVKFKHYGGETSGAFSYTVRSCAYLCDAVAELVPGGSISAPKTTLLTLPPVEISDPNQGEASVAIQIECVQLSCSDPPELVVKDFEMEYDDSVAPLISNVTTDPEGALTPLDVTEPTNPSWIRGESFKLSFDVVDHGSGMASAFVSVGSIFAEQVPYFSCSGPQGARPCDEYSSLSTVVDIRNLADGEHGLAIYAVDAAASTLGIGTFKLFVDNEKPAEPTGLGFSSNVSQWGWTSEAAIIVSHDDATLEPRNTNHSGFNSATFDARENPNGDPLVLETIPDPEASAELTFPSEGEWDVGVTYQDNAGNSGNRAHEAVGYDADAPEPADPVPHEWISLNELHGGIDQTWTAPPEDPALESGICAYSYSVDDQLFGIPIPSPDVLAPTTSAPIPAGIGEGKHFAHVRAIACNGRASETETVPVNVDGTAPVPVLHGLPTNLWLTNAPTLSLSATDTLSGVAAVEYGFDGPGSLNLVPGASAPIDVPQGAQTLTYRAIDVAGNVSPFVERAINADWTPPIAEFVPRDPVRPNVLTARVEDSHSGLAGLGMQIRRTDSGASAIEASWRSLGDFESLTNPGQKVKTISRSIPDGDLPDGAYEIRATARDVAGNWSDNMSTIRLSLPVRSKPALSAAIALVGKRSRVHWSGASRDRVLVFGKSAALVGTLIDAARNPISNARIVVTSTPEFGVPDQPRAVTTDARGEFVVRLPKGPTRRFDVKFEGNDRTQPLETTAHIRVRAALRIKASRRTIKSGQPFSLSGRLLSGSIGLPEGGKVVQFQFLRKRKWLSTLESVRVDSRGRFKAKSDGILATRSTRVYFRVRAERDGAWPFLSGSSTAIAVRVKPSH